MVPRSRRSGHILVHVIQLENGSPGGSTGAFGGKRNPYRNRKRLIDRIAGKLAWKTVGM